MWLRIVHTTRHVYAGEAIDSQNELRLCPSSDANQLCHAFVLRTDPHARIFSYDLPGGTIHHFGIRSPHVELTVTAEAVVQTFLDDPFVRMNLAVEDQAGYDTTLRSAYAEWLVPTARVPYLDAEVGPGLAALAHQARAEADGPTSAHFLVALTRVLHREIIYQPGATSVDTRLAHVLAQRRGVCQDSAHVMLAVCRREGIPARYVSGYLFTGHGLVSGDQMHAWVECLVPDAYGTGPSPWIWRGWDPTNNLVAGKSYVRVHHGRDYDDIVPIKGVYSGAPTNLLRVDVRVFDDGGGVTKEGAMAAANVDL